MSPNDIEILIHVHCTTEPHPRMDAPAVKESFGMFIDEGIFDYDQINDDYELTNKGRALLELLCQTPFPRSIYVDKYDKEISL